MPQVVAETAAIIEHRRWFFLVRAQGECVSEHDVLEFVLAARQRWLAVLHPGPYDLQCRGALGDECGPIVLAASAVRQRRVPSAGRVRVVIGRTEQCSLTCLADAPQ